MESDMSSSPSFNLVAELGNISRSQWAWLAVATVSRISYSNEDRYKNADTSEATLYSVVRCVYLLYFHPLSKYPGPRLAAVSNVWWAYHW